jgi:hypothetical protein
MVVLAADTSEAGRAEAGRAEAASAEPVISQADPCILGEEFSASQVELARSERHRAPLRGQITGRPIGRLLRTSPAIVPRCLQLRDSREHFRSAV